MKSRLLCILAAGWVALTALAACSDDLYAACDSVDDCAPPTDTEAVCVDDGGGQGFCSWLCDDDSDCDVDTGDEYDYLCAPFESNNEQYCFPSCEGGAACPPGFGCRSTGGGANNRKICFPGGDGDGELPGDG